MDHRVAALGGGAKAGEDRFDIGLLKISDEIVKVASRQVQRSCPVVDPLEELSQGRDWPTELVENTGDVTKSSLIIRLVSTPYTRVWAHMSAKLEASTSLTSLGGGSRP